MRDARATAISLGLCLSLVGLGVHAQDRTPRERFARAVELAAEGDHRTALVEFRALYELTRNPELLFNIAASHEHLNEYAEALEVAERYGRLAPAASVARHREELAAAMMRLASRVGTVMVAATPADARCTIDATERAREALTAGLRLSIGPHTLRCEAPGYVAQQRTLSVAPSATAREVIDLARARARITVQTDRVGATVRVDGVAAGVAPLSAPLEVDEGRHRVRVEHPGYEPVEQEVDARGDAARIDAPLRWRDPIPPEVAARLRVQVSEDDATLSLDDHPITGDGAMRLPPGQHRLTVTRTDFIPVERPVDLAVGATLEERVHLQPTARLRDAYVARARRQRLTWQLVTGGGALLAVVGGVLFAATLPPLLDAGAEGDRLTVASMQCSMSVTARCPMGMAQQYADEAAVAYGRYDAALPGVVAGAVLLGGGVAALVAAGVLAANAEPVDRFERAPTFRVALRPGGAGVALSW
ncbi:MAG: PEGA domain-containing protein [Polyangiales bacterium]